MIQDERMNMEAAKFVETNETWQQFSCFLKTISSKCYVDILVIVSTSFKTPFSL